MDIRQLTYFLQVAEDLNYSTAAQKLFITQPTLSWTIKNLEKELNLSLFKYADRRLTLTVAGMKLQEKAEPLVAMHQDVLNTMLRFNYEENWTVNVGISQWTAFNFPAHLLLDFLGSYDNIKLSISDFGSYKVQELVSNGTLDLGIVSTPLMFDNLHDFEIPDTAYYPVLLVNKRHRLAKRKRVGFEELKEESFVLLPEGFIWNTETVALCQAHGFTPHVEFTSVQIDLLLAAIGKSLAVSVLPNHAVDKYRLPDIVHIPVDTMHRAYKIAVIVNKAVNPTFPIKILFEHIKSFISDL